MASAYDIVTVEDKAFYRLNKNIVAPADVPDNIRVMLTAENVVDENGTEIVQEKASEAQEPTEENTEEIKSGKAVLAFKKSEDSEDDEDDDASSEDSSNTDEGDQAPAPGTATEDDTPVQAPAAPAPAPKQPVRAAEPNFKSNVPQSHPGMGFPRVNGKTVDIFDGQTPHTHNKNVGGIIVPLSAESFRSKSDGQIISRLRELGMSPIDFAAIGQATEQPTSSAGNAPVGGNVGGLLLEEEDSDERV